MKHHNLFKARDFASWTQKYTSIKQLELLALFFYLQSMQSIENLLVILYWKILARCDVLISLYTYCFVLVWTTGGRANKERPKDCPRETNQTMKFE